MKLSEMMANITPKADYEGFVTNDDFVLAINTKPNGETITEVKDYEVVELGIGGLDAQMNPITVDKTYIRASQSTMRTGNQRSFAVTGDRYIGDPVQDFLFSHKVKYGTGNAVITDYVYFCLLNGKGEKGRVSIIINSDGSGEAGNSAEIDVELKKNGKTPEEFDYSTVAAAAAQTTA